MSEVKTWKCDGEGCKQTKTSVNHWWMLTQDRQDGQRFAIAAFSEASARDWPEHFCGTECLLKRLSRLMHEK